MADITSILEDLAAGRIDAAEASKRIDAVKNPTVEVIATPDGPTAAEAPSAPESPASSVSPGHDPMDDVPDTSEAQTSAASGRPQFATHSRESFGGGTRTVQRITVRAVGRRVRIIGDASVASLSADGPHVLRRTGTTIGVTSDGEIGPSLDGFSIIRPPRSLEDLRTLSMGKELVLRINPAIPVDVEVTAGSLSTTRLPVLGKVRVTAGGASLVDVVEVTDALVQAGSATITGAIQQGRSRVRVESGTLTVYLTKGANVAIHADTQLARVSWPIETSGQVDEYVVGNGAARLDIGIVMGHATIKLDEDAQ